MQGIASFDDDVREEIITKVRAFDAFTPDNNPRGERDFGTFVQNGDGRTFWKIDYYDRDYQYGSSDPADPAATGRVLTIMLALEY